MVILSVLGAILVVWTIVELGMTTLTARGAGPLTSRGMQRIWQLALLCPGSGERRHALLSFAGPVILAITALTWFLGLWIGWWLIFLGGDGVIVGAQNKMPASAVETLYFAGYTITTLGLGDFKPTGPLWQVLTAGCAANGLLALTLSVTYLVPVISAAVQKRQLALTMQGIGGTPRGILERCFDGEGFASLGSVLAALSPQIITIGQQHLAYPALHYFHSAHPGSALPVRLAALSETVELVATAVPENRRPQRLDLLRGRDAMRSFLSSIRSGRIRIAEDEPPRPDRSVAEGFGFEPGGAAFAADEPSRRDRRLLLSLVRCDGWDWDDIARKA